jgi:hypothetical protein
MKRMSDCKLAWEFPKSQTTVSAFVQPGRCDFVFDEVEGGPSDRELAVGCGDIALFFEAENFDDEGQGLDGEGGVEDDVLLYIDLEGGGSSDGSFGLKSFAAVSASDVACVLVVQGHFELDEVLLLCRL